MGVQESQHANGPKMEVVGQRLLEDLHREEP